MRVKLLTYHFSDNYGALFQAYALREWFGRRNISAEFINYHPRYVEEGGSFDQPLNPRKWKKNLTIAYLKVSNFIWSLFGNRQQKIAFDEFRRDYLGIDGQRLFDATELQSIAVADLLVCGSDQIWNPSVQKGLDPVYFLDFDGAGQARRVSYAASFGKSSLPTQYHATARKFVSALDAISVREQSGVDIVRAVSGREAVCVPDPTILLRDFRDLLDEDHPSGDVFIFCYALRTAKIIRDVAEYLAKIKGIKLISPRSARQRWRDIGSGVQPGPVEWLRLLNSSAIVVTNSFHGIALSLVLNRPFLAVALPGRKSALNERASNLLSLVGLSDRVVTSTAPEAIDAALNAEINWLEVNKRLTDLSEIGARFLETQLASLHGQNWGGLSHEKFVGLG